MCSLCDKYATEIKEDFTRLNDVYIDAVDFFENADEEGLRCPVLLLVIQHIDAINTMNMVESFMQLGVEGVKSSAVLAIAVTFMWGYRYGQAGGNILHWTDDDIAAFESGHLIEELERMLRNAN